MRFAKAIEDKGPCFGQMRLDLSSFLHLHGTDGLTVQGMSGAHVKTLNLLKKEGRRNVLCNQRLQLFVPFQTSFLRMIH